MLDYASIARRVGMFDFALRLLHPIVRSEKPLHPEPTASEVAMYAAVLVKIGAREEALSLLAELNSDEAPEVLLFQSSAYIGEWKYSPALPYLRKYVKHPAITDYQKRIGEVNLAAALIAVDQLEEAQSLLQPLLEATKTQNQLLLQGNTLELLTQIAVVQGNFSKADSYIQKSNELIGETGDQNSLFVKKWKAISAYLQDPKRCADDLMKIRQEAIEQRFWEVARDCDFHRAIDQNHKTFLTFIIFGTPYKSFRKRVLKNTAAFQLPKDFIWQPSITPPPNAATPLRYFDLMEARGSVDSCELKFGHILHRALSSLTTDFYVPRSLGEVFNDLYPGEIFNPITSPKRVFRVIQRLRKWVKDNNLPISIVAEDGSYRLHARDDFGIKVPLIRTHFSRDDYQIGRLKAKWPYQVFSAEQAAAELGLSSRQVRTLISTQEAEGDILRIGSGRSTRYRFAA